jgi:hypothetical protein
MALREEIPRELELRRGRKMKYRVRCAWGGNHLRRRGADGNLLRAASARSTDGGFPLASAIDGYRPHTDPLDAAYVGWWKSTGTPLALKAGLPYQFYEPFADWLNWSLATYGAAAGQSATISGKYGLLTVASSNGSQAGYSGVLSFGGVALAVSRDQVFQMQLGNNRLDTAPYIGSQYGENGFVLSDTTGNNISAEVNALEIVVRNTVLGQGTLPASTTEISFRRVVGGVATMTFLGALGYSERSDNLRAVVVSGTLTLYSAKYGILGSVSCAHLPSTVYVKVFSDTNANGAPGAMKGYFRDLGIFPSRKIYVEGEPGFQDEFETFSLSAWNLTTRGGEPSLLTSITRAGEKAIKLCSSGTEWACAMQISDDLYGDWEYEGRFEQADRVNVIFCAQDYTGDNTPGYVVQVEETQAYFGKDIQDDGSSWGTTLANNVAVATPSGEIFTLRIVKLGSRMRVYKNDILIFDITDADYADGRFGYQTYGGGFYCFSHKVSPRGLQQPTMLRIDRPMIQNRSFDDWDDADGLTESQALPGSWQTNSNTGVTISKGSEDGPDGGGVLKMDVDASALMPYLTLPIYQQMARFLTGHKYRVSYQTRFTNTGGGLVGGYPILRFDIRLGAATICAGPHDIQIATPAENLVAFDEWALSTFNFTMAGATGDAFNIMLWLRNSTPGHTYDPTGDFSVEFTQLMIEDITGLATTEVPALEFTDRPVTYRGQDIDRVDGVDFWRPFYEMPLNVIWRLGDNFTWGLIDEDNRDLFTSRNYTDVLPGSIWVLKPEWLAFDLGVELGLNQILFYPYYLNGIRYLLATYGGANFSEHEAVPVMKGLTVYSSSTRLDLEMETAVRSRFVQVVILDCDTEGAVATCQQVELYDYADESDYVTHQEGGSPEVSITMTRPADKLNPLPDAATASVALVNSDQRYTPYNKYSPLYGPYKQQDGLGDIRAGVPVKISMLATDESGVDYETLMFLGSIGVDKNKGGSLGVTVDGTAGVATIDAVDFTVPLDQPVPVSELNPLATISAEDTIRALCYLAGIPYQDMILDATGVTFPVVVFREQTMRENIQQLVQAIGGRFFTLRDGRLRYQNAAVNRSWTMTDRQEFEGGTKSNIDTQSVPGEFWMENTQWLINHMFGTNMPDGQTFKPWTVNAADSWRFLSNGEYAVITPAGQSTKMQHVLTDAYDKAVGFTLEWDAALVNNGGPFQAWGYTSDAAAYTTAACAWRLSVRKVGSQMLVECGGQMSWLGSPQALYSEYVLPFFDTNDRIRIRITVKGTSYKIYFNDCLYRTVALTTPRLIRWNAYESNSGYKDEFGTVDVLNGRVGDTNTTGDVWHDVNNRWHLDGNLHKVNATEDWTAYLDFGCSQWWLKADLYLDRTTAREGGWMVRYIDANNWVAVRIKSDPDPGDVWQVILTIQILARVAGGAVQTLREFTTEYNAYAGSQHIAISSDITAVAVFISKYNPTWTEFTLWHQVGVFYYNYQVLGNALMGATRLAPYFNGGANIACSWDHMEIGRGSCFIANTGPAMSYALKGGGSFSMSSSPAVNTTTGKWYPAISDTYAGKIAMGLDPAQFAYQSNPNSYSGWSTYLANPTTGYRLAYFRERLAGDVAPLNAGYYGVLTSPVKDLTAAISAWGIFEAEVKGVGRKQYSGLFDQCSNVDFYVQVSSDGVAWDAWVKATRGQLIPATVAFKRYIRWQARLWRSYQPWITVGYPLAQYQFANYWKAHVLSATVNWQISTAVTANWFRATWDAQAGEDADTQGIEMNSAQYSLGNPEANRVTALVNRWVEQLITNSGVNTDPFWQSSELPTILNLDDVYVINAEYTNPSRKGDGRTGTLRHTHIQIDSADYVVNDGGGNITCGNATVRFDSGQGVGVITVTSNANGLVVNSALIDAVYYRPASELYGTERVFAEDVDAQLLQGRVIDTETFDNAFAMSRAIAQGYADAELVRTKQYNETIQGVQIPVMPSVSLEHYGVIHNPVMGVYERQVQPMDITHQGFVTVITGKGIRTQEELEPFDPLALSPTGAFATFRLPNCASSYIMQVRSELTGEVFDIYDWQQYFEHYQLTAGGDWIDAGDEDFRVAALYDQTGNGRDLVQSIGSQQPALILLARNGFPALQLDGVDDYMYSNGYALDDYFDASAGHILVNAKCQGAMVSVGAGEQYNLPAVISDSGADIMGIGFGDVNGGGDLIHAFNVEAGPVMGDASAALVRENWSVLEWRHSSGAIKLYQDAEEVGSAASGGTSNMSTPLSLGEFFGVYFFQGMASTIFLFDLAQSLSNREKLVGYMQAH